MKHETKQKLQISKCLIFLNNWRKTRACHHAPIARFDSILVLNIEYIVFVILRKYITRYKLRNRFIYLNRIQTFTANQSLLLMGKEEIE